MINLLERFSLAHTQLTRLNADLSEIVPSDQTFSAKVELKLTPLEMAYEGERPQYQVTARMLCRGSREDNPDQPLFTVELVMQAVYAQFQGDPVDFETFKANHGTLTRQLYPLIHHQLQPVFKQFGLDQVKLPYDLAGNGQESSAPAQRHVH
ncbi:MAG: hypothetical protein GVY11_06190 [Gammaproteobacteria bacterium]|jgi:hypothetical protein|nr:hypothetical protein [Gammaproteobacteria bacterium]